MQKVAQRYTPVPYPTIVVGKKYLYKHKDGGVVYFTVTGEDASHYNIRYDNGSNSIFGKTSPMHKGSVPLDDVFHCVRVYPDGEARHTFRTKDGKDTWVGYNSQYRGGNYLFVDGEYIEGTGHPRNKTFIDLVSTTLKNTYNSSTFKMQDPHSDEWNLRKRNEIIGGTNYPRVRYPDDAFFMKFQRDCDV